MTQNKKEVKVMPAGLPILAAGILWFVLAMILPIYKAVVIIIVSAAAIAVMMIMFSMRKKQLAMQPPASAVKVRAEELARKIDTCCRKPEGYAGQIKDRTVAASVPEPWKKLQTMWRKIPRTETRSENLPIIIRP